MLGKLLAKIFGSKNDRMIKRYRKVVKAINAKGCGGFSRKDLDDLTEYAGRFGARGMAWIKIKDDEWQSPITKFFSEAEIAAMGQALDAQPGDLILFGADKPKVVHQVLSELRLELARRLQLVDENSFNFLWVTDFPLLEYDEEQKRYSAVHHPFTAPNEDQLDLLTSDPGAVKSRAYDLVLGGLGSDLAIAQGDPLRVEMLLRAVRAAAGEMNSYVFLAAVFATPAFGWLCDRLRRYAPFLAFGALLL